MSDAPLSGEARSKVLDQGLRSRRQGVRSTPSCPLDHAAASNGICVEHRFIARNQAVSIEYKGREASVPTSYVWLDPALMPANDEAVAVD